MRKKSDADLREIANYLRGLADAFTLKHESGPAERLHAAADHIERSVRPQRRRGRERQVRGPGRRLQLDRERERDLVAHELVAGDFGSARGTARVRIRARVAREESSRSIVEATPDDLVLSSHRGEVRPGVVPILEAEGRRAVRRRDCGDRLQATDCVLAGGLVLVDADTEARQQERRAGREPILSSEISSSGLAAWK